MTINADDLEFFENTNDLADADQVLTNTGFILSSMIGFAIDGLTTTNQINLAINPAFSTSSNSIFLDVNGDRSGTDDIYFCRILDEFEDASVDATIWTTASSGGSVTESGGKVHLAASGTNPFSAFAEMISDQGSGVDFKALSGDSEVVFRYQGSGSGSDGGSLKIFLYVGDTNSGTTSEPGASDAVLVIDSQITGESVSLSLAVAEYNLIFDKSGDQCRLFKDGVEEGGSPFDLSALSNWFIYPRVFCSGGIYSITSDLFFVGYIDGAAATGQVTTSSTTITSSNVGIINFISDQDDESSFTMNLSADNGSNFTSTTNRVYTEMGTPGTSGILRFQIPLVTSISKTAINIIKYGLSYGAYFG